jgi:hypothetical protein
MAAGPIAGLHGNADEQPGNYENNEDHEEDHRGVDRVDLLLQACRYPGSVAPKVVE